MERRLSVGDTLREAFSIYRDQAWVLLPVAFALFLVVAVVNTLAPEDFAFFVIPLIFSILVGTLYQGMVVRLVQDVQDGSRDSSVGDLMRSVLPVLGPLVGAGILAGIGIGFGTVLLVVPGLYLMTIWAVIAPVIVVEDRDVLESFGRSRQLVRDYGWQVFAVVVLIVGLISFLIGLLLVLLVGELADSAVLEIVASTLASTITAPIEALVASVLYFRLLELKGERASPSVLQQTGNSPG
jgi:hypothetical protein